LQGWVNWALRRFLEVTLGAVFIYAGIQKHFHPQEFAEAVMAYRLLPEGLVGFTTAVLPWVEIAAGLFLAAGLKRRSCLQLLTVLAVGFLLIMLITLARGLKIDCGCGLFFQRQVGLLAILEDVVFLIWAGGLYWWELKAAGQSAGMVAASLNNSPAIGAGKNRKPKTGN
jgi:putative oxidoreductase